MRHFAVLVCLGFFACSISAAPLPESSLPVPGSKAARPAHLIDRDGDRVSDGLQATIAAARPGDLFRVIVAYSGPGNAAAARQAVGFFVLHHEFKIINGFSATMTAAQIRALAQQPGVFRIEEDFPVSVKLDAARPDFGIDAARAGFGVTGAGIKGCIVDTGVDPNHEQLTNVRGLFRCDQCQLPGGRVRRPRPRHPRGVDRVRRRHGRLRGRQIQGRGFRRCDSRRQGAGPVRLRAGKPGDRRNPMVCGPRRPCHFDEPRLRRTLRRKGRAEPGNQCGRG